MSLIRQKGESQNGCFKKTKHVKFSEKRTFLTPCAYQGVRNVRFFGKFSVLCFLETPVLRFALLPYYRWIVMKLWEQFFVAFQCDHFFSFKGVVFDNVLVNHPLHSKNYAKMTSKPLPLSFFVATFTVHALQPPKQSGDFTKKYPWHNKVISSQSSSFNYFSKKGSFI